MESSSKLTHVPPSSSNSTSSSSNTVSISPLKPGLNFPSIPKAPQLAPGQIPNGKGPLSSQDKKQDSSSASTRRPLYKRQGECLYSLLLLYIYVKVNTNKKTQTKIIFFTLFFNFVFFSLKSEREFNPDIHCGVMDMTARKPCTRSLTCKVCHLLHFEICFELEWSFLDICDPGPRNQGNFCSKLRSIHHLKANQAIFGRDTTIWISGIWENCL